MSTFTPPSDLTYPAYGPDSDPRAKRLLRWHAGNPRTRCILLYDDDTICSDGAMPPAAYNADGSLAQLPEERVSTVFAPHQTVTLTATQQTTLEAAGFSVD